MNTDKFRIIFSLLFFLTRIFIILFFIAGTQAGYFGEDEVLLTLELVILPILILNFENIYNSIVHYRKKIFINHLERISVIYVFIIFASLIIWMFFILYISYEITYQEDTVYGLIQSIMAVESFFAFILVRVTKIIYIRRV